jgi:hypothetical protein
MNVVPILDLNAADLAQQLRALADQIESGDFACDTMILVADPPGGLDIRGWGKVDGMRCIGLLNLASHNLMRLTLDWMEAEQEAGGSS